MVVHTECLRFRLAIEELNRRCVSEGCQHGENERIDSHGNYNLCTIGIDNIWTGTTVGLYTQAPNGVITAAPKLYERSTSSSKRRRIDLCVHRMLSGCQVQSAMVPTKHTAGTQIRIELTDEVRTFVVGS